MRPLASLLGPRCLTKAWSDPGVHDPTDEHPAYLPFVSAPLPLSLSLGVTIDPRLVPIRAITIRSPSDLTFDTTYLILGLSFAHARLT